MDRESINGIILSYKNTLEMYQASLLSYGQFEDNIMCLYGYVMEEFDTIESFREYGISINKEVDELCSLFITLMDED